MSLEERIMNDYKDAMKSRDTAKSSALSFLRSEMMKVAIDKRKKALDDSEIIAVIKKQIKQRQDSIEQFEKGGRTDLAEKEKNEVLILKAYLPQELSVEAVKEAVRQVIAETGAAGMKDMGKVMKETMAKLQGQADGKVVSDTVKEMLSGGK